MQRSRRNAGRTAGIYLPTGRQGPNVPRRFRRPPLLRGSIQNIQQSGPENGFEAEGDCVRRRQRGASCPGSGSRPGPASGTWSPRGATSETWSTRGAEMTISGPRGAETTAWRRRPSSLLEFISTRYGPLFFVRFVVGPSARDVIRGLRIGRKVERFSSVIPRFRGGVFGFFSFLSAAPLGLGGGPRLSWGTGGALRRTRELGRGDKCEEAYEEAGADDSFGPMGMSKGVGLVLQGPRTGLGLGRGGYQSGYPKVGSCPVSTGMVRYQDPGFFLSCWVL